MDDEILPDLRSRMIASALVALERGDDIGLRALARDAGVSAMAPYRHFRDKAALLAAVARRGFDELKEALEEADATTDAGEALVGQGEAYIAFARAKPALFRLMFTCHTGVPAEEETAYGVLLHRIRTLDLPNPDAAALACWSAVHGMAMLTLDWSEKAGAGSQERAALTLVVRGITQR